MNDLKILVFVYLTLKHSHVKDRTSLIDIACEYGKRYGVTKKEVKKILNKKLIDFL